MILLKLSEQTDYIHGAEVRKIMDNDQIIENAELNDVSQTDEKYGADEIQVLEGLEAVRKRPGMYIGSTGPKGLHHLVYEIVDNSIDEALAGYCTKIDVEILPGNIIRVSDNGRGIPVGIQPKLGIPAVTVVFTVLHAGGKFGGGGYKVAGGLHGVGASVVNALSEWTEVEVYDGSNIYKQRFERGVIATELENIGTTDKKGTIVTFKADPDIFMETTVYEYETLSKRLREQAFLNAGIHIELKDLRNENEIQSNDFCYSGGVSSFVEYVHKKKGLDVIHPDIMHFTAKNEDDTASAEIAMQYNDSYNEDIRSFANNIHTTDGGTHEEGFKKALTRVMNNYARKFNILKDDEKNRTNPKNGLCMTTTFHRAYDKYLMAITPDYEIVVSDQMMDGTKDEDFRIYLLGIQGRKIHMPDKFMPSHELLAIHYEEFGRR